VGSAIWSIFTARRYVKHGICRRRVSARFVLTVASRGPSAIAELLVMFTVVLQCSLLISDFVYRVYDNADYAALNNYLRCGVAACSYQIR